MSGHPTRAGWFSGGQIPCDPVPPRRDHAFRLVLVGPPGVGKGTQALLLCDTLRACHLSTGDLFRAAKCDGAASPAMRAALEAMHRGELVPDDLVIEMVRERHRCLRCHGGFLLDGFPRTLQQAEVLDAILSEQQIALDAVLCFELPIEEIVHRLSGRRTCKECRAVCHVAVQPPAVSGVCDHCGGTLFRRDDDEPDAIRVRMRVYEEETAPLIDFYEEKGTLLRIQADGTPEDIHDRAVGLLHEHMARARGLSSAE